MQGRVNRFMENYIVQELLLIFINNMIPVLAIASVGFYLRRQFAIDPKTISTMMFRVFSPALTFYTLFHSSISGAEFLRVYGSTILLLLIIVSLAFLALKMQKVKGTERAATLLATHAFNGGNFGLSIVLFAFGESALSWAVVAMVAGTTMTYSLGVYIASNGQASVKDSLLNVLKTPPFIALLFTFALKSLGVTELPVPIDRTAKLLADASIPLMLVLLGLQMGQFAKFDRLRLVFTGVSLRLLVAPMLAVVIAGIMGITGDARLAFITQAGMPTAVVTIVLATEFNSDRDLALTLIMVSTFLSPITLSVLIYLLQNGII